MENKYNLGDKVWFFFYNENKIEYYEGNIVVVDKFGTFENPDVVSYDIEAKNEKYPEGCWYKHICESHVFDCLESLIKYFQTEIMAHDKESSAMRSALNKIKAFKSNIKKNTFILINDAHLVYVRDINYYLSHATIKGDIFEYGDDYFNATKDDEIMINQQDEIKTLSIDEAFEIIQIQCNKILPHADEISIFKN